MPDPSKDRSTADREERSGPAHWSFRLYVANHSAVSLKAIQNLQKLCEKHLEEDFEIEVIDLVDHPELASEHQVLATPTLVRRLPPPVRKLIGDLSATRKVLVMLDIEEDDGD